MDDFERRLGDALHSERERVEERTRGDLPRIKGTVMDSIHTRRRSTMFAAVAAAAVVLAAGGIFVPRILGDIDPDPAPPAGKETPSPEPTLDESVAVDETEVISGECSDLPFRATYLPEGYTYGPQPGDGGQVGVPLDEQNPQAYGHFTGGDGFISVYELGGYYTLPPDAEEIQIFDQWTSFNSDETTPARFGSVEDGYALEFSANGCDYSVIGFGVSKIDMWLVADGLMLTQGKGIEKREFAIYPELSSAAAAEACSPAPEWRKDAASVVERFAIERLGIETPSVVERHSEPGAAGFMVGADGRDVATVEASDVGLGCWSVVHVLSELEEEGFSFRQRAFKWRFGYLPPGDLLISIGYAGEDWVEKSFTFRTASSGSAARVELGYIPVEAGAYLIVLKDGRGITVGAAGGTLPPIHS